MDLRNVVLNMQETFGKITFAGEGKLVTDGNGRSAKVIGREYRLYAEKQPADNISVILQPSAGEKHFEYEDMVALENPHLEVRAVAIDNRQAYSDYILYADNMKKL